VNKVLHLWRCPIFLCECFAEDLSVTGNKESLVMAPNFISFSNRSFFIDENGYGDVEFVFVFQQFFFSSSDGQMEKNDVSIFDFFIQFIERRSLFLANGTPDRKEVQNDNLSPQFFQRDLLALEVLQRKIGSGFRIL